jgi:hypothetical protein
LYSLWGLLSVGLLFWWFEARFGYNPTDDGFILSHAWRIASGEMPHVDFTSPRPVGSGLIHLPEMLTPWGMLALDRLVVVGQLVWIAYSTVGLFDGESWNPTPLQRLLLVSSAFLLNVGAWPVMAWHTIDGLFVGMTALWLAVRDRRSKRVAPWSWTVMWLLCGFAPLVKQGFAVVPILVAVAVWRRHEFRAFWYSPLTLVPPVMYLFWAGGNIDTLQAQFYSGSRAELLAPLRYLLETATTGLGIAVLVGAVVAFGAARLPLGPPPIRVLVGAMALTGPVLVVAQNQSLALAGSWSYLSVLALLAISVLMVRTMRGAEPVVFLLVLGYAACMSWGVPAPSLMAGTFLAFALMQFLDGFRTPVPSVAITTFLLCAALLGSALLVVSTRSAYTYRDLPRAGLTATVDSPQFALIRMSPQSAAFVDSVRRCVERYPASRVAVLPDGPGNYPLLGLRNPFHMDWWIPLEFPGDHDTRVAGTVERLNREDDWLVLVQTYPVAAISQLPIDTLNRPAGESLEPAAQVLDGLEGDLVTCDSFVGEYRPVQ